LAEQGCRFLEPVFIDDTVTSRFEVHSVHPRGGTNLAVVRFSVSLLSANGQAVLEGHHVYLLKHRLDSAPPSSHPARTGSGPSDRAASE
jgi:acyl dehydratase